MNKIGSNFVYGYKGVYLKYWMDLSPFQYFWCNKTGVFGIDDTVFYIGWNSGN